LPSSNGN